ncbi:MAG TPA: septation protein SpoVG family protein [Candidatus Omnitrophota bacterium]|nr:septation protein SpoVG family protein [Candidatus Omnitrophota bacterium]
MTGKTKNREVNEMMEETLQMRVAGKVRMIDKGRILKAFVDICFNNVITVKSIRILDGKKGLFVSMPQHRGRDGKWYDTIYCPNTQIRGEISEFILSAYRRNLDSDRK